MKSRIVIVIGVTLCSLYGAGGQCTPEVAGVGSARGVALAFSPVGGECIRFSLWDPDGTGPRSEMAVFAGDFDFAGDVSAHDVCGFDGEHFHDLATAGFYAANVERMEVAGGKIYISGSVSFTQGTWVAGAFVYDGVSWERFDDGFVSLAGVYKDQLVALRGLPQNSELAIWDGNEWTTLGPVNNYVTDVLETPEGMSVSGHFTSIGGVAANRIASFDGQQWSPIGEGFDGFVGALAHFKGQLYAGGSFLKSGNEPLSYFARWTGAKWEKPPVFCYAEEDPIHDLAVIGGQLIVAGGSALICTSPGVSVPTNIFAFDGETSTPLGFGTDNDIHRVRMFDGLLVAAGEFANAIEDPYNNQKIPAQGVARWDGSRWRPLSHGFEKPIDALFEHQGSLFAGGAFLFAGPDEAKGIARFDGGEWRATGFTFEGSPKAFESFEGQLVAGGGIKSPGATTGQSVVVWDGASWSELGGVFSHEVRALREYKGDLYASGIFDHVGGVVAPRVARWDGAEWSALAPVIAGSANTLARHDGKLVVAGTLTAVGGIPVKGVANWDGAAFSPMGGGVDGIVWASASVGNFIYLGGSLLRPAGMPGGSGVVRWDGSVWTPVDASFNGFVVSLQAHGGGIFAGDGSPASSPNWFGLARWDGNHWVDADAPPIGTVPALARFGNRIAVGGNFTRVGFEPAHYFATLACPCPADCDNSGSLDVFDILCFFNTFNAQHPYADCNQDGVFNALDYECFTSLFAGGCQ